ncbi:LOW QUALITY PROTEIN: hypothetical protein HZS_752 [Henneguya salminicola]|nr:LOW QUALITY PROTEIN: hypothetical protein HZS_752 [Henneguya salminicola]
MLEGYNRFLLEKRSYGKYNYMLMFRMKMGCMNLIVQKVSMKNLLNTVENVLGCLLMILLLY